MDQKKREPGGLLILLIFTWIMVAGACPLQAKTYSEIQVRCAGTVGDHKVKLTWKKVKGASGYLVERQNVSKEAGASELSDLVISRKVKKTRFLDRDTKKNKMYQYTVYAKKKGRHVLVDRVRIKTRQPKVLILDCSDTVDKYRMKAYLRKAGFSVSVVKDVVRVNERKDTKVSSYDGLVIPGGKSVNPCFYHSKKTNSHSRFGRKENDRIQIDAVREFKKAGKPVLGICRGSQLVNVALGGTLIQCIGREHDHYGGKKRPVRIKKNSWLYYRFGNSQTVVHSHHQNVKKLGKDLIATQWDKKEGNVEGYEHKTLPIFGLQWHPDKWKGRSGRNRTYVTGLETFREFRSICQQWMVP